MANDNQGHQSKKSQAWFVKSGDDVYGPIPATDVKQRAANGDIGPTDLLSRDRKSWYPAQQVRGIRFGISTVPPAAMESHPSQAMTAADFLEGESTSAVPFTDSTVGSPAATRRRVVLPLLAGSAVVLVLAWLSRSSTVTQLGSRTALLPFGASKPQIDRIHSAPFPEHCTGLAFSPDGETVVTSGSGGVALRTVSDLGTQTPIPVNGVPTGPVVFSPTGKTLAIAARGLEVWDISTLQRKHDVRVTHDVHYLPFRDAQFSPDETSLSYVAERSGLSPRRGLAIRVIEREMTIGAVDLSTGESRTIFKATTGNDGVLTTFSADGRWFIASHEVHGSDDPRTSCIRMWSLADGHLEMDRTLDCIKAIACTPDGRTLLAVHQFLGPQSPDGSRGVWCELRAWSLPELEPIASNNESLDPLTHTIACAGDSRTFVVAGDRSRVTLWRVDGLALENAVPEDSIDEAEAVVDLSRDGTVIAIARWPIFRGTGSIATWRIQ